MEKTAELGLVGGYNSSIWRWREFTDFGVAVDKSVCCLNGGVFCVNIYHND